MLDEGLFAMQYVNSGSVTELRVNGRVLMLFPFGKKARAAIQCVTDLICLFKNLNVISLAVLIAVALIISYLIYTGGQAGA